MDLDALINDSRRQLTEMVDDREFASLFDLFFSREPADKAGYTSLCKRLGLRVDDDGFALFRGEELMRLAAMTMIFASLSEDGLAYPLYLNSRRENVMVRYLQGDIFIFERFDILHKPDVQMLEKFSQTLRSDGQTFYIDMRQALLLLHHYLETSEMTLALSDYCFAIEVDDDVLGDFNITDALINRHVVHDADVNDMLFTMLRELRLDARSYRLLYSAMEG